ncbi:MAG: polysaccharide lyase [Planctomycetota bacterium]
MPVRVLSKYIVVYLIGFLLISVNSNSSSAATWNDWVAGPNGKVNSSSLKKRWGNYGGYGVWSSGGRLNVIQAGSARHYRVNIWANTYGYKNCGISLNRTFGPKNNPATKATVEYRIRFSSNFNFGKGGKLPGFGSNTSGGYGGRKPTGTNGWSSRNMWLSGGRLTFYCYHMDMPGKYGQHLFWKNSNGSDFKFRKNVWYTIKHEVKMNTPGKKDGYVKGWINGRLALNRQNLRFRTTSSLGINRLNVGAWRGGNDRSWAVGTSNYIDLDNIKTWWNR